MAAIVYHLPVKPQPATAYDLEGWEILTARHLLEGARLVTPSERAAWAAEAGLTGVARCMASLSGLSDPALAGHTDASVAAIYGASRR
jgi:hypothetical protein